jgi:hypothetical protein
MGRLFDAAGRVVTTRPAAGVYYVVEHDKVPAKVAKVR